MQLWPLAAAVASGLAAHKQKKADDAAQAQARQDKINQQNMENRRLTDEEAAQAQRAKDDAARLGIDQDRLHDERTTNGLNSVTGARNPIPALPQTLTQGKANSATAPLQQQYAHARAIANFYANDPDPQAQKKAAIWNAAASQLQNQIRQKQQDDARAAQAAANQKQAMLRAILEHNYRMQEHSAPTYRDLHPTSRGGGVQRDADGLTPSERINVYHWSLTHNPDGSPKFRSGRDPYTDELGGLDSPAFKGLPSDIQATTRDLVSKHGITATTGVLEKIASGAVHSTTYTKSQAAQALHGLTTTGAAYKDDPSMDDSDDEDGQ